MRYATTTNLKIMHIIVYRKARRSFNTKQKWKGKVARIFVNDIPT